MCRTIESGALLVVLATAGGVSISLPTHADEAVQSDWLPNAPVESAVILGKGRKTRLALVNLMTATYEELDARPDAGNPIWSPNGSQLLYRAGRSLYRVRPHGEPPTRIHDSLPETDQATGVYVFSPDGQRLAVNTPGFQLSYPTWSADGQRLAACRWNRLTGMVPSWLRPERAGPSRTSFSAPLGKTYKNPKGRSESPIERLAGIGLPARSLS